MTTEPHDTYTFGPVKSRWSWRCLTCGAVPGKTWKRRMDADDDANDHIDQTAERTP